MNKRILSLVLSGLMMTGVCANVNTYAKDNIHVNNNKTVCTVNGQEFMSFEMMKELGISSSKSNGKILLKSDEKKAEIANDKIYNNDGISYAPMKELLEELDFNFDFDGKAWLIGKDNSTKKYTFEDIVEESSYKPAVEYKTELKELTNGEGVVIGYVNENYAKAIQEYLNKMNVIVEESSIENGENSVYDGIVNTIDELKEMKIENLSIEDLKVDLTDIENKVIKLNGVSFIDANLLSTFNVELKTDGDNNIKELFNKENNKQNARVLIKGGILNIEGRLYLELHDNMKDIDIDVQESEETATIANGNNTVTVNIFDIN